MKQLIVTTILALATIGCVSAPQAIRVDGSASLMNDGRIADEQPMAMGRVAYQHQLTASDDQPANTFQGLVGSIGFAGGHSSQTLEDVPISPGVTGDLDFDIDQLQGDLGLRLYDTLADTNFQPFIGVGLAPTYTELSAGPLSVDGFEMGGYAEIGVDYSIGRRGRIGVSYRYTGGLSHGLEEGQSIDFDNSALVLSLGWSL